MNYFSAVASGPYRISRSTWLMVLLALTWAIECWIVQGFTLRVDVGGSVLEQAARVLTRGTARFLIDLLAALSIIFFVASRWLHILFAGSFLLSLAALAFYGFYGEPLTWTLISEQFAEGIETADSLSALVDSSWAFLLVGFLTIKISLLEWAVRHPAPANLPVRIAARALLAYVLVMLVLWTLWPPSLIGRWASFSLVGNLYGYTTAWLAESLYIDQRFLLAKANAVAQRRSALYGSVPLMAQGAERIVAIQAESLDLAAIDTMLPGGPLMPFLQSLRDSAVFTAIEPVHMTGSSDADFTFLMAVPPNGMIAPYKVAGFDFTKSVIALRSGAAITPAFITVTGELFFPGARHFATWASMRLCSSRRCSPFSRARASGAFQMIGFSRLLPGILRSARVVHSPSSFR